MPTQPKDIFEEIEPARHASPQGVAGGPTKAPAFQPANQLTGQPTPPTPTRWPLLVGGTAVLLMGIAAVVVFWRRSVLPTSQPALLANTTNSLANQPALPTDPTNTNPPAYQPAIPTNTPSNDQDSDGLVDDDEAKLGTNPNKPDTDGDALSDYDEVKVYKTNPLKPDTDGDGITDGVEVKKGYNPNGSGKLLDFEAARQKLNK